jgi:hypothetical protein
MEITLKIKTTEAPGHVNDLNSLIEMALEEVFDGRIRVYGSPVAPAVYQAKTGYTAGDQRKHTAEIELEIK